MKIYRLYIVLALMIYACSPNNVKEDSSVKRFFDENNATGCFGIFDNGTGQFTIYNLDRFKDSAFSPFSSFDIIISLVGLETGIVFNDSDVLKSPDTAFFKERSNICNPSIQMSAAFKNSCMPWFRVLAKQINKSVLQKWLDSLGYGNRPFNKYQISRIDTFWLDNSLKISADEQMGVVKKLYFSQLPFQPRTQRIVKSMMMREENANFKLAFEAASGALQNGIAHGWISGWIEENRHPYFFAIDIDSDSGDIQMKSVNLLKSILKHYGFMEGKK